MAGLPLNGRSYSQLVTLQSGVSDSSPGGGSRGVGGGNLTVAGGRSNSNSYLLDGTNIMSYDNSTRSAAGVLLGSDGVLQVQVFSPNYGAEYGRNSGGVLNSLTRSGTNELHGTLFEYFRNSKLDARNFFDDGPEPPPFKRNQCGFMLSGPVWKDNTYFMGSFEAMRDRLSETGVYFFPDSKARKGEIGTEPFPIHPSVQPYLDLFPVPKQDGIAGIGEVTGTEVQPTDDNFFTVRVDHRLTSKDGLFARYTFDDASSQSPQGTNRFYAMNETRQHYLTLVGSHIFNLRALTAFRFGYTRPQSSVHDFATILIDPKLYFSPAAPYLGRLEVPGVTSFGAGTQDPRDNTTNTFQFANDTVVQTGSHGLKWGFEIHRYHADVSSGFQKSGVWTFSSLESFLQGGPAGTSLRIALPGSDNQMAYGQTYLGLYLQDSYRVAAGLQVNLGLRYEHATLIHDENGKDIFLADPVRDTQAGLGPFFKENPGRLKFAPRIGVNWAPGNSRTLALAAGFGIYYDHMLVNYVEGTKSSAPFYNSAVRTNFDSSGKTDPSLAFPNGVSATAGIPHEIQAWDYAGTTAPMVLRYNFAIQKELPGGWRLRASYVGARGNHLVRSYEANLYPIPNVLPDGSLFFPPNAGPINPNLAAIETDSTDVQSFYNSFQFNGNKTLGRGSSVQVSYTYAKSVDDASGQNSDDLFQFPRLRTLDRGLSDFDLRQRLTANFFYPIPLGGGQRWLNSGVVSKLVGGWRLGGIVAIRSGTPFSPRSSVRTTGYLFAATRPNLIDPENKNPTSGTTAGCFGDSIQAGRKLGGPDLYFDPCVYNVPAAGTMGNAGRNTLIGPSVFIVDLSIQRDFVLDSQRRVSFRAEIFNLPNHTNFGGGASNRIFTGSTERPRVSSSAGKIRSTATTSRQIQFALRFTF
ncbi:MAG: TonB-dependent receptor [Acidobacteria bacterium]|nr:TonB-dependent receptor [Acidobacteriota bacterium]